MDGLCYGRDLARRLFQNLQRSNGRVLAQRARTEHSLVETFAKVLRVARRLRHIKEQRRAIAATA